MKFSTLIVLAPLLAAQVHAFAIPNLDARAAAKTASKGKTVTAAGGKGSSGGNAGGNASGGNSASAASAASSSTTTSAASQASAASGTSTASASTESTNAAFCGTDPQNSLCLLSSQVQTGLEQNGQETPEAGQVPSLTSNNNFINFCATVPNLPLTNGQQVKTGSCNPTPMGSIISQDNMPSCKFQSPANLDVIQSNTAFTISLAINNLETGNFVSATQNYYAAPAQLNAQGILIGHSHVVVEEIDSLTSTTVTDPTRFAFFKGLNDAAVNGILTADVTGGLPAGVYKMSTINSASNHQPALVAVAQHAALDDAIYFTVSDDPSAVTSSAGSGAASSGSASSGSAASSSADTSTSTDSSSSTSEAAATATAISTAGKGGNKGGNKNTNTTSTSVEAAATASAVSAAGKGGKNTNTTSTSAAATTTTAKTGGKGVVDAGVGASKSSSTAEAASTASAASKGSSGLGSVGKGQTTVVEPPSCG